MTGWDNSINNSMAVIEMLARSAKSGRKKRSVVNKELLKKSLDLINQVDSSAKSGSPAPARVQIEQQSINLSGLIQKLKNVEDAGQKVQENQAAAVQVKSEMVATQSVSISMELTINKPGTIDGLVLRSPGIAESDRYRFDFNASGQELSVTDKWTLHSTRIWGDPHVDLDDIEGDRNGEFTDLTKSNTQTSFILLDGTRLTISAQDNGLIQQVDIFKGSQHIHGTGFAGSDWSENNQLFTPNVLADGFTAGASLTQGDTVYSGGDGSDWFDASGKLVWGHAGVPTVKTPPPASLEFKYTQTVEQSLLIKQVETSA